MIEELKQLIGSDERILYEGKPDKKCYIFESIFNPLLPFALLWALFDSLFIGAIFSAEGDKPALLVFIPFFALHLMPVWIYLGGILFTSRKYKNTAYIVTDKAVYISGGLFTRTINRKSFAELSHINLHRGFLDQIFNVGDILLTSSHSATSTLAINSISNYIDVYNMIKKLQTDIYSDVMFPNDMRPETNHGYNTKYKGL